MERFIQLSLLIQEVGSWSGLANSAITGLPPGGQYYRLNNPPGGSTTWTAMSLEVGSVVEGPWIEDDFYPR